MELYKVVSRINGIEFENSRYDNVLFNWFLIERQFPPADSSIAILNYSELSELQRQKGREYLGELFTKDESERLKKYLDKTIDGTTNIEEIILPVPDNMLTYRNMKPGFGIGFTDLYNRKNYPLKFKVRGLFNINDSEEKIIPDERPTTVSIIDPTIFEKKDD